MKVINYFKGVGREAKKIRWPERDTFLKACGVVLFISVVAAIFLALEDLASGTLIEQLGNAFKQIAK